MAVVSYILPTFPTGATQGFVAHKNGGQTVLRARAMPVHPVPHAQRPALNATSQLSVTWELLTNAQRIAWGNYAFNVPLINAWGFPVQIRGYAHYMRANRPRVIFRLPPIDDGPTDLSMPDFTTPDFVISPDASTITVTVASSDDWANEDGAYLLCFVSRPHRPASTRPPNHWQPLGTIAGAAFAPPATQDFPNPWAQAGPDADLWLRYAVTRADGRYTSSAAY